MTDRRTHTIWGVQARLKYRLCYSANQTKAELGNNATKVVKNKLSV